MIGRKEEKSVLDECLVSSRPEFLVIYGRRRVGKTYLVKEYFQDMFSFYATGVAGLNTRKQLRVFKEALVKYGDRNHTIPKDWFEAFTRLEQVLMADTVLRDFRSGKRIVFLDELPWMDTAKSDFKSALDYFWNSWGSSQKDLMLIVCGSASSWILNNIVKDNGGFYNRITRQIHLLPFSLRECEQLLLSNEMQLTRKQMIECYMVFGGIPYYLNYLRPSLSLAQNIDLLFFQENSPLKHEFTQLLSSLYKNADNYISIVTELSKTKYGLTRAELADKKNVVSGKELTKCLEHLDQCGFIRKYRDFTRNKTSYIYQLIDPLSLFCLTFVESGKIDSWIEYINTPSYYAWCGLSFERVCLLHTKQIKQALGISGIASQEFAWKSKKTVPGSQIDLLIDRKDDVINVCEMKYASEPFVISSSYEQELTRKIETFRAETGTSKALLLTFVTMNGISNSSHKNIVAHEVTSDELFS